jgi:hypothetical protein
VVPITTVIKGSKMCFKYHIFHDPGLTFILVGVPLRALLRGVDNGECLKMVVGHQEFSSSFAHAINHAAKDELKVDLLQVMETTLKEELAPPCLDDVADSSVWQKKRQYFRTWSKRPSLKPLLLGSNSCHQDCSMSS